MSRKILLSSFFICTFFFACKNTPKEIASQKANNLAALDIIKKAHEKAGGHFWQQPKSLTLKGHAVFYKDGKESKHETHLMWRVFDSAKQNAHKANGKVRIASYKKNNPVFIITYDGEYTYDLNGKQEKSDADTRWASNFGYGAIRHALDEGYSLQLMADDTVHTKVVHTIKVIDPKQGETFFGIDKQDFKIVKVAFQTPRGWHHREYSNFFSKDNYSWLQSGKVSLFYDGKLSNEVFWEDFEVNQVLPDSLFVLK